MPRLNTVDPSTAGGEVKEIFDGPLAGKHLNIFRGMGNSPAVLNTYLAMAGALGKSSLSAKEQEVVHLTVSEQNKCTYCLAAHTAIGKGAGLTEEETVAARRGELSGDAKLAALNVFAGALHEKRGFVSDEDIAAFKAAGYDDGAVGEVVATYALATFTNYFNHVYEPDIDFPAAPSA